MDIRAWCGGKNIDEVCPEDLKDDWKNLQKILKSHVKSHQMVGLPIDDRFWKILPKHFTSQREDLKEFILEDIKNNINKALKLFKRKFKNSGVLKELRERQQYTKKSRKNRIQKDKAIFKQKYLNNLDDE